MAFPPLPLTANATVNTDADVKDSCKCFCCIPFKAIKKSLTPRKKTMSVEIRTEMIRTEILEKIDQ